jgi:hypothetical protein
MRKTSLFERTSNTLILSVEPRPHECKLAYAYGHSLDRVRAPKLFTASKDLVVTF